MKKLLILLSLVLFFSRGVSACEMGLHEWELAFDHSLPISGPIIPAQEFSVLSIRFTPSELTELIWVDEQNRSTAMVTWLKSALTNWAASLPFRPMKADDLGKLKPKPTTAILKTTNYVLRAALFTDKLSNHRCKQLVITQEGRLRLAMPAAPQPLAENYPCRSWVSIFFFDTPVPSKIISVTAFPVSNANSELYLNEKFITELFYHELVQRRPSDYMSPYPDGFPFLEF
jgi:hypothetical protein